jgi:LysM repeat protein
MFERKKAEMAVSKAQYLVRRIGVLSVLGLALAGFVSGQVANATSTKVAPAHYTVHQGDTIWGIAKKLNPGVDPRDYMFQLVDLNQLKTAILVPGQDLVLPSN